jgi:hypothetical protein
MVHPHDRNKFAGQIEVIDGKITQTTPSFRWAIGMDAEEFALKMRHFGDVDLDHPKKKRLMSLGRGKFMAKRPTDADIARRTRS